MLGTPSSLGAAGTTGSQTAAISGVSCAAGDLIVVAVCVTGVDGELNPYAVDSVTIGAESLTEAKQQGGTNSTTALWYVVAAAAHASATITAEVSLGTPTAIAIAASKTTGAAAVPLDKTSSATGTGATPNCGATGTRSQADEVIFAAVGTRGPAEDTPGTWADVTAFQRVGAGSSTNAATVDVGQAVVSNTTDLTADKSGMTSRNWMGVCATFKASLAQASTPSSISALASVCVAALLIGAVGSSCTSINVPTSVNATVGHPGARTVVGSSVTVTASVSPSLVDEVFTEVAGRAPQTITALASREGGTSVIKTLRARDTVLRDGSWATFKSDEEIGPYTGDLSIVTTGVAGDSVVGSGAISGIVLHCLARLQSEDSGGESLPTVTNGRFDVNGHDIPMLANPPSGGYAGPTQVNYAECQSALVTTTDGGTTPWTWANIYNSLLAFGIKVHVAYAGVGVSTEFDVCEAWIEVYGPIGSAPSMLRGRDFMGRLRGTDVLTTEIGGD